MKKSRSLSRVVFSVLALLLISAASGCANRPIVDFPLSDYGEQVSTDVLSR